ncbi:fimbria/pilus periplasmic chaperone [Pantoea sp. OXWO6B1]|uniref:fimbria/pilus periplasmic chaperone n=1 Tax=Pantoea sp. OXWO6B1 TaxID=1835724 RepID=UPI0007C7BA86|nr:fimbria/pilus periplasmic chaperone [Pantoea sp. OXWO6B1]OAD98030.1 molecular chaperone [Pantoea sp. OXWO6B1]
MKKARFMTMSVGILVTMLNTQQANAALALDRTRVIFPGGGKSVTVNIHNENTSLPYLAQSWVEDEKGNKISSPLVVVPPLQRVEAGSASQLQIKALPDVKSLPQDRESVFYFNLREIPPRSNEPNTLQLALQTRIKLFYRPKSILPSHAQMMTPWQDSLTLSREGDDYKVINSTPYFISLVSAGSKNSDAARSKKFKPLMVAPKGNASLGVSAASLGSKPTISYINDYGGTRVLTFKCNESQCKVSGDEDFKN